MPPFRNVNFNIIDQGVWTRCVVNPGEDAVPCTIIGADTTVVFKNKDMTDPSNTIAATNLAVNGTIMPIVGTAVNGEVLTVNNGTLEFLPVSGSSSTFIKYVSAANPVAGDGSINNPYKTITAAITALGSGPEIKTIYVLPGNYSENVELYPNTVLIGSGINTTRIMPTFTMRYSTEVSVYEGAINVSNMTVTDIAFDTTTDTVSTATYNFTDVSSQTCTLASDNTATNNIGFFQNCNMTTFNADLFVGAFNIFVAANAGITIRSDCSFNAVNINALTLTGPLDPDISTIRITISNISAATFIEGLAVLIDATSLIEASIDIRASVEPINLAAKILLDKTSTFVGTNVTGTLISRSTAIGADIIGIASESINRTGLGYGATLDADYQVAFADGARMLKASGLIGHAAATNVTYDTVTGRINYATSSAKNKEEIEALCPDRSGLLIDSIVPRKYRWKESGKYAPGLIAEEVAEIVDNIDCESMQDLIARNASGEVVTVNYTLFVPHLINCIKDLRDRVSALEKML